MSESEKVPACEWCQMFRNWKEREQCAFCRGEEGRLMDNIEESLAKNVPDFLKRATKDAEGPKEEG